MELSEAVGQALERLVGAGAVSVEENGAWVAALEGFHYQVRRKGEEPLLYLWSDQTSVVRRVVRIAGEDAGRLTLEVARPGHTRPDRLEFVASETPRRAGREARERFRARFRDVLAHQFPDETQHSLTTAADLEHSLSGNYARGIMNAGPSSWAVMGAAPGESAATYDALLTFGLLWLDRARQSPARSSVAGLRVFFPRGAGRITMHRLQALSSGTIVHAYEYDTENWRARRLDARDAGNLETWLSPCREGESALTEASDGIEEVQRLAPQAIRAQAIPGTREVALRFHGLTFARTGPDGMFYGLGDKQQPLTPHDQPNFAQLISDLATHRSPVATDKRHRLYRAQPERWLETLVAADPTRVDARLDPRFLYSQVPALAAGDRGVLDLLGITRSGRLAIVELKVSEDPQLLLQAVDYWLRVRWHQMQGDFPRYGYFPGVTLDPQPPLLFLVAPSLQFHSAVGTLLPFLNGEIDVTRVGVSEHWRRGLKVVLRQGRQ